MASTWFEPVRVLPSLDARIAQATRVTCTERRLVHAMSGSHSLEWWYERQGALRRMLESTLHSCPHGHAFKILRDQETPPIILAHLLEAPSEIGQAQAPMIWRAPVFVSQVAQYQQPGSRFGRYSSHRTWFRV